MIYRNPSQRVAVLVDVQNLYYSAQALFHTKVNYKNLLQLCVQGRTLTRAIAYTIKTDDTNEQNFFEALNSAGFEVKEKDLHIFVTGAKKGDWDVGIAMDTIRIASKVDTIVLVSGDGDFSDLVVYLKGLGCRVEVMGFDQTTSSKLKDVADDYTPLDKKYLI